MTSIVKRQAFIHRFELIFTYQQNIEFVDSFTYLGSNTSRNGKSEIDVKTRFGKLMAVFQELVSVWSQMGLNFCMHVVIPTALFASEIGK